MAAFGHGYGGTACDITDWNYVDSTDTTTTVRIYLCDVSTSFNDVEWDQEQKLTFKQKCQLQRAYYRSFGTASISKKGPSIKAALHYKTTNVWRPRTSMSKKQQCKEKRKKWILKLRG